MTDKEMFSEYDKLKKQSVKLQKRLRKAKTLTSLDHMTQDDQNDISRDSQSIKEE
jgi:hypothetical protein